MASRREFLGISSLAIAGTACSTGTAGAAQGGGSDVPPSIAALESMAHLPTPITGDERLARVEKARRLMGEQGFDALMLTGGTSLRYFSNISWGISERLLSLIVPASGEPFLVCPAFEEDRAREQLAQSPFPNASVMTWEEHENPYTLVAQGLRERGIASGRLGVEETVRHMFAHGIGLVAPALEVTSGTPITAGCRMVKDAHELELMQIANNVTLKAYEAAYHALDEGMTQSDFANLVSQAHTQLGFQGGAGVQTGEFSALPHGSIQPQIVREGTILLIDGGCGVEGYRSDISRTFVLGAATDRMKQVYEIELAAQMAAIEAVRPGVECQAIDAAARKVIVDAGFGPDYTFFSHRVGHGIGMDGHEWPYLVKGNTLPLEPGMTFSDEPGIYIPGEFGIRLEDDFVVTEDGGRMFTPMSPSLEDPFGPMP